MKLRIAALIGGILLIATPLRAVVVTWTGAGGPGNRDMLNGVNWDTSNPPGPGDTLVFPGVTNRLVTLDSALYTAGDISFTNATNFSFNGTGSPTLVFGGNVTLQNTNVNFLNTIQLQFSAGAHTLTNDAASVFEFASVIGGTGSLVKAGAGTLTIHGASSYSGGTTVSEGSLVVDAGSGFSGSISHTSADLIVGGGTGASLEITAGGTVANAQGIIGNNDGESGSVSVHGAGSTWSSDALYVGNAGTGTLYLYDNGQINVGSGSGIITLGHTSPNGVGILKIGTDGTNFYAGGVINAAEITTGAGLSGELKFATTGTALNPYYLTADGTSNGAPVLISGNTEVQQLNGFTVLKSSNTYTGATYVSGGTLIVSDDYALGQGFSPVTVNGGTLVVNDINFYNPLTLTSGTLAGSGYVAANTTIGSGITLSPGLPADGGRIGSLDFAHLELASGGTMEWNLQNPTGGDGAAGTNWDLITISTPTSLDITATSGSRFTLKLISLDALGALGTATGFVPGQTYSWLIFGSDHTTGFDPTKFDLDLSQFVTDSVEISNISLTNTGDLLYLNFTPVPEPSTYALLALGLASTGLAAWRKRRHGSRNR